MNQHDERVLNTCYAKCKPQMLRCCSLTDLTSAHHKQSLHYAKDPTQHAAHGHDLLPLSVFVYGYCESIEEILQQELYEMLLRIVEV